VLEFTGHRRILAPVPSDTQTGGPFIGRFFRSPLALSLVVVACDAIKPVTIDDTAYLAFARQIAHHPLDPYGFEFFWYARPEPAFEILAPPVVPYWLGLGIAIFGETIALLKLWLLPFVWLFAWSASDLLHRFARGTALLPAIVVSPAVLPAVNLMIDIPALGLGLAAIALFVRAADGGSRRLALASGVLAALALQTKYTMLIVPPVILWYGLTHARSRVATLAVAVAVGGFAAWEISVVERYGRSHFVHHAASQQIEPQPGTSPLEAFMADKAALAPGLAGQFGCLGVGAGLIAAGAAGISRRWLGWLAAIWAVGFTIIALAPGRWSADWVFVYWQVFGVGFLLAIVVCALLLLVRFRRGVGIRWNADSLFLAGWFAGELAAYFVLTPFPAARRVIGLSVIGLILGARMAARTGRLAPARRPPPWLIALVTCAGVAVAGIDTLDAFPEKSCAERAAMATVERPAGSTVWFAGHWGFQYYCERAGMSPLVLGRSRLCAGDYLILPAHPDAPGFHRPHLGSDPVAVSAPVAEVVAEVKWDDRLSAQTVPNYYGGINPVVGRDHPRLRVVVYRITRDWIPVAVQRR
jgi:4-amino-4-deoxy-L-arabinose transferase-like glycosyltransferase